jgi:hypothetical protein
LDEQPLSMSESFEDDFSDPASGWEAGEFEGGRVGYVEGAYSVISMGDSERIVGFARRSFDDLTVQVDATQVSAPANDNNDYGVGCRIQPTGEGYYLLISGDGFYGIRMYDGSDFIALVEWTESEAIVQGNSMNAIEVTCDGSRLSINVNGELLAEVSDSTYTTGDIVLSATSYEMDPTEVLFDNLIVTIPRPRAEASDDPVLDVATYKAEYEQGQHPTVHGELTRGGAPLVGVPVSIEMTDADGGLLWGVTIETDENGSYLIPLTQGAEIPGGYVGDLYLYAEATYEGMTVQDDEVITYLAAAEPSAPCAYEAWGWFDGALQMVSGVQDRIGCATGAERSVTAAYQDFEGGIMVWRGDQGMIYVFYDGGGWERFEDLWQEGMSEQDVAFGPTPEGYVQPKRGFGLVWEQNGVTRDRLGWALHEEALCDDAHAQSFEYGEMMVCSRALVGGAKIRVFILYDDGSYEIFSPA